MKKRPAALKNSYTQPQNRRFSPANDQKRKGTNKKKEKKKPAVKAAKPSKTLPWHAWARSFFRFSILAGITGMLFFGIALGMQKTYLFCTTNNFFNVAHIEISGNSRVHTNEIMDTCRIKKGMNSLTVDLHEIERKLIKNPWIEYAGIKRELPDTIKIEIKERQPIFCAKKNNTLYYINARGEIIAPVESRNFISLPTLEIGLGGSSSIPQVANYIDYFKKCGFPLDMTQISWIKISAGGGFELFWESKKIRLSIGLEKWQENIRNIIPVMTDIEKRKEIGKVTKIYSADSQVLMTKAE